MSTYRLTAALLIAFGAAGCASAPKLPLYGTWRVASYSATQGVNVPSPVQALAWVGVRASFEATDARFGGDRCTSPKYTPQTLTTAEFQTQYHALATAVGLSGDTVTVYGVECGYPWGGQTKALIVKSPTALLMPWGGTFFELERLPPAFK